MDGADRAAILYWDDFSPGHVWRFGSYHVTADEIVEFARRYDPMPMHVDAELALKTPLGVFCASGIHTFAMTQKIVFDNLYSRTRLIAGAQVRNFLMRRPVLPGDVLCAQVAVVARQPHHRRSDAGWVDFRVTTTRADDQTVLEHESRILFERRADASPVDGQM